MLDGMRINSVFDAYTIRDLQVFVQFLQSLEGSATNISAVQQIILETINNKLGDVSVLRQQMDRKHPDSPIGLRCSQCGGPVHISAVNTSPRNNIGGGYHTAVECLDGVCLHQEYSEKFIEEYQ